MRKKLKNIRKKTIQDFGNQWKIHGEIKKNFWSSKLMFKDHFGKLFNPIKIGHNKAVQLFHLTEYCLDKTQQNSAIL